MESSWQFLRPKGSAQCVPLILLAPVQQFLHLLKSVFLAGFVIVKPYSMQ